MPGACDVTDVVKSVGILKEAGKLIDHRLVKRVWMPIPASAEREQKVKGLESLWSEQKELK